MSDAVPADLRARWDEQAAAENRQIDQRQREYERRFRLLKFGEIEPRPLDWRIHGLFEDDSLLLIVGDPSAGKSFWALDMAACIATGTEHHGRAVKQGSVAYIAGEGHNGLARRRKAWEIRSETDLSDAPLYLSSGAANIGDPESTGQVLAAIEATGEAPALVVLDTLNRNMAGDENNTDHMRSFIHCCDEIRTAYNCTVALVHHTGHGDKSRARGSSVLHGAIDTTFHCTKDAAGIVKIECTRMKDGPQPDPFAFTFRSVELGFLNEDGTEAASAVLHPCGVPEAQSKPKGKNQRAALDELHKLHEQYGENLASSGHDPSKARVRIDHWREACMKVMNKSGFYAARDSLEESGQIVIQTGGYVVINER